MALPAGQVGDRAGELDDECAGGVLIMRGPEIRREINIDRLFHALGDPTRRAILDRLSEGPVSVSHLATPL